MSGNCASVGRRPEGACSAKGIPGDSEMPQTGVGTLGANVNAPRRLPGRLRISQDGLE